MKHLVTLLMILFLSPISAECAITKEFGPYYGKVIDADTREPIDGAAVLVVFYTESYGPAGAITHYADALETVTDKNGEFKFPEHRITLFRPLQGWNPYPQFRIFKPGYGCYPDTYEFIVWSLSEGLGFSHKFSDVLKSRLENKWRKEFEEFIKTIPKEKRARLERGKKIEYVEYYLPILPIKNSTEKLQKLDIPFFKIPDDINLEDIKWIDMREEHLSFMKLTIKSAYKVIGLLRLRTREERLRNQSCFPVSVPDEKMKKLIELNNIERINLGLDPSHIKEKGQ